MNRRKAQGRRESGTFTRLPHHIFRVGADGRPPPAAVLSHQARCFLVDTCQQLNGKNNGNLSATPATLRAYGWTSKGVLADAVLEVLAEGFLEQTRQGGKNRRSLYAVTWRGIDEGPHDAIPNPAPSNLWMPENADKRDAQFVGAWRARLAQRRKNKNASRDKGQLSRDKGQSA